MKKMILLFVCTLLIIASISSVYAGSDSMNADIGRVDLFVSLQGDDNNQGTVNQPFKSIERAKLAIRNFKKSTNNQKISYVVWLRGGVYDLASTFSLNAEDSGYEGKPVVYSAYPGEEVRITGAVPIDSERFSLVSPDEEVYGRLPDTAKDKVLKANLKNEVSFGELKKRGMTLGGASALEIFCNEEPMQLSRWPDICENNAAEGVIDGFAIVQNKISDSEFTYKGNEPERWSASKDVWYHGLWSKLWADFHVEGQSVDQANKTIRLKNPPQSYGIVQGAHFYAENVLEEITVPGEWYLDRGTGYLYFWPPADIGLCEIRASSLDKLISLNEASWVRFEGITFEMVRDTVITVSEGSDNLFYNCRIRNSGGYGSIISGKNNGMYQCEIAQTGNSAVTLKGGDRINLIPAGNYVRNCDIHDFGRWSWMYQGAVHLEKGIGNIVANNEMYNSHHLAIWFKGNDHIIEYNNIHDVCRCTDDAGAIYSGRDWGWRGNIIRYNFIHDMATIMTTKEKIRNIKGIYLDGFLSDTEIYGNTLYGINGYAIKIGGGRDNTVENNVMARCSAAFIACEWANCLTAADIKVANGFNLLANIFKDGIKYQEEPWASAYPSLAAIPNDMNQVVGSHWAMPEDNVIRNNIGYSNDNWLMEVNNVFDSFADVSNNIEYSTGIFVNEDIMDLRVSRDVVTMQQFASIPFDSVGPSANINLAYLPETVKITAMLGMPNETIDLPDEGTPSGYAEAEEIFGILVDTICYLGIILLMVLIAKAMLIREKNIKMRFKK